MRNSPVNSSSKSSQVEALRAVALLHLTSRADTVVSVGSLPARDELFWSDIRSKIQADWQASGYRGDLIVEAQTSLKKGAIPGTVVDRLLFDLEAKLKKLFQGKQLTAQVEDRSDFGTYVLHLSTRPLTPSREAGLDKELAPTPPIPQNVGTVNVVKEGQSSSMAESKSEWRPSANKAHEAIAMLLQGSPTQAEARLRAMTALKETLAQELAKNVAPPMQSIISVMPCETREQKQAICTYVNGTLREFGLAVRCPNTGRPALLMADHKQSGSEVSRFRWETRDDTGKKTRSATSTSLPQLELCPDEPRKEGLVEWTKRIGQQGKNRGKF